MNITNIKTGDTHFHNVTTKGFDETRSFCEVELFDKNVLEVSNKLKQRPLHIAVTAHNIQLVEYLLNKGACVDAFKKGDWTSLMIASTLLVPEATAIAKLLISKGANCKLKNKDGWTSMHLACKCGNLDVITLLGHAEPSLFMESSRSGRLPIHVAALNKHPAVVSLLISRCGSEICNAQDACGSTPAMDAVCAGSMAVLEILNSHIKIQNQKDKFGLSCLHKAAQMGYAKIIKYLVNTMGFDVNERTTVEENTPLHYAVMEQKREAALELLSLGASTKLCNKYNQTVLQTTRGLPASEVQQLIQESHSD